MTNVVILAPRSCAPIQNVLLSWSALGLIGEVLWVEAASLTGHGQIHCLRIVGGQLVGGVLQQELPREADRIRLCSLHPFGEDADTGEAAATLRTAINAASSLRIVPIRVVLPRDVERGTAKLNERTWHNMVVAPESVPGPSSPVMPLDLSHDPLAQHEAAVVASLGGLWASVPAGPLDDEAEPQSDPLALVRTAVRGWEGQTANDALAAAVLDVGDEVPRSPTAAGPLTHLADDAPTALKMASEVWEMHRAAFKSERVKSRTTETSTKSILEILALFWSFLIAGLRNPRAWLSAKLASVQAGAAVRVGKVILGDDSSIEVVWSKKHKPSNHELGGAASDLSRRLTAQLDLQPLPPATDFPSVWEDFAMGALTLVDGQKRGRWQAPAVGNQTAVVRSASSVVPSQEDGFDGLSTSVGVTPELRNVSGFDVLKQEQLMAELARAAEEDQLGGVAFNSQKQLRRWIDNEASQSYAARFGRHLYDQMEEHRQEIGELVETFTDVQDGEISQELASHQRNLARTLKRILLGALVAVLAVAALLVLAVISWPWAVGLIGMVIVGGLGGALMTFVKKQQRVFAAIHEREQLVNETERKRQNLRLALRDLERSSAAYDQFLAWSRVLGEFLHRPFGRHDSAGRELRLPPDLPPNVFAGSLEYSEHEHAEVAGRLREKVFQDGWLGAPFRTLLEGAGDLIGPDAFRIREEPRTLFREPAGKPSSMLERWASALESNGVGSAAATDTWGRLRADELARALQASRVSGQVRNAMDQRLSPQVALADVDSRVQGGNFDIGILSGGAVLRNANHVEGDPWVATSDDPTAHRVVRVEFSRELTTDDFKYQVEEQWRGPLPGGSVI